MTLTIEAAANGGVTVLLVGTALVLSKNIHGEWTNDYRHGIQRAHEEPTPRVGGIALLVGLMAAFAYAAPDVRVLLKPMIIACLPAFFFGLAEDITRRVRWQERLLATICSGLLIWWLTGTALTRLDIGPREVAWVPVGVSVAMRLWGPVPLRVRVSVALSISASVSVSGNSGPPAIQLVNSYTQPLTQPPRG